LLLALRTLDFQSNHLDPPAKRFVLGLDTLKIQQVVLLPLLDRFKIHQDK